MTQNLASQGALDTSAQIRFEKHVRRIANTSEVRAARRDVIQMYRDDPQGRTAAGQATLEDATAAITESAVQMSVHNTHFPALMWSASAAHSWHGIDVPASGYGIDNPDNVHRHAMIDGGETYVIRGRLPRIGPAQQSFVIYEQIPGSGAGTHEGAPVVGSLTSDTMEIAEDGTFTVTTGPGDVDGRANHIVTTPGSRFLIARDALSDWSSQLPARLDIERTSGGGLEQPPVGAPTGEWPGSPAEQAVAAAALLRKIGRFWLDWDNERIFTRAVNSVTSPQGLRSSGFGCATSGHFALRPGQALVITLDRAGAGYLGFQVADPWGVGREYTRRSGSLNQGQARSNSDGTYTYVIAAADPGSANWLDTGGIDSGIFAIRWQSLPPHADISDLVRSVDLVDSATIGSVKHPPNTVDAATRQRMLDRRISDYTRRLTAWP